MIVTLTGENSFLLKQELSKLLNNYAKEHGKLAIEQLDGEEASYEQIFDALTNISMFDSNKMVVVREFGACKQLLESIEDILPKVPETTEVVLVSAKLDKRSKAYKGLQKLGEFKEFKQADQANLPAWVIDETKELGGQITRTDATYLVNRIGADQMLLGSEVAKLVSYDPNISRNSIDLLCEPTPQSTVFQLLDAAFAGNYKRALGLYEDQRKQRVEPLAILGMVAWQLHIMALVKTAKDEQPGQVAKDAKLNPFVVNKNLGLVKRISLSALKKLVRDTLNLDIRLKSESIDADEAMKQYLLELSAIRMATF